VGVEKLLRAKLAKTKIAIGCRINDFLNFLGILYPPNSGRLEGTSSFSTATPDYTHHPAKGEWKARTSDKAAYINHK
jgi:hypothetical protein